VELAPWRVPAPIHRLKYSLFHGYPGIREVGYDNGRGKADHRHFQGAETARAFSTVDHLIDARCAIPTILVTACPRGSRPLHERLEKIHDPTCTAGKVN
jgi:hypothetical protein